MNKCQIANVNGLPCGKEVVGWAIVPIAKKRMEYRMWVQVNLCTEHLAKIEKANK